MRAASRGSQPRLARAPRRRPRVGAHDLRRALALWRGPALADFEFADFAQQEIRRLDELHLETLEGRFEAMLRLGRHGAMVAELEARVAEHPLRERLRGQLMLALYRSGRQAEALEVYRKGRRLLADELGLEPGTELQLLEKAILTQDPSLDPPARVDGRRRSRRDPTRTPRSSWPSPHRYGRRPGRGGGGRGARLPPRRRRPACLGRGEPPALVVIDPATNRVVASIRVGSKPAAMAAGEGGYGSATPATGRSPGSTRRRDGCQDDRDRRARRRPRHGPWRGLGGDGRLRRGRADRSGGGRGCPADPARRSRGSRGAERAFDRCRRRTSLGGRARGTRPDRSELGGRRRTVTSTARKHFRSLPEAARSGRRRSRTVRNESRPGPDVTRPSSTREAGCFR